MPDSTLSRLESIRKKIRRLTKSPVESQLTTETIDSYVNSFILYDLPTDVSLNSLKTVLKFYTEPYIDKYSTETVDVDDPLYNFKNKYTLASNVVYLSGNLTYLTNTRASFYSQYPRTITEQSIGTGDGVTTNFNGTLDTFPVLRNTVLFASRDNFDLFMKIYENGIGTFEGDGVGLIDYITGGYNINFNDAPKNGEDIYCRSYTYGVSQPRNVLFHQDSFYLRPVPDKCYSVEVEVFERPTELLDGGEIPDLAQWWEYISFGSAYKILVDRGDFENAALLESEMQKQREKVLYKTIIEDGIRGDYGI